LHGPFSLRKFAAVLALFLFTDDACAYYIRTRVLCKRSHTRGISNALSLFLCVSISVCAPSSVVFNIIRKGNCFATLQLGERTRRENCLKLLCERGSVECVFETLLEYFHRNAHIANLINEVVLCIYDYCI
jgi:hypothetical protein